MSDPEAGGSGHRNPTAAGARLERTLAGLQSEGRIGLMTHIVLGYPSLEESIRIVDCMAQAGVDLIEVQIPFSDPTADGPVITAACQKALDGGIRVDDAFRFLADASARHDLPFLFMSYFNLLFAYGEQRGGEVTQSMEQGGVASFVGRAAASGACGLIVPDIPPECTRERYPQACREAGVHPVYVVSPNTSDKRLRLIAGVASGFVYATSRTGTTGREMEVAVAELSPFLSRTRRVTGLPVALGFSLSRREQLEALSGHADVAVVGTHLMRVYEDSGLSGLEHELRVLRGG